MTLLGKIFTMLIFICSIFFCALSVCVFMTQKNWREYALREQADVTGPDTPLGLVHQLANAETKVKDREEELRILKQELARERAGRAYALAALEESRQIEADLRRTAEATHAELLVAHREAASAMAATQARLESLTTEIADARTSIKVAQGDRDDKQERVVFLTDELHKAEDLKRRLEERQAELVAQISRMQRVLRANDLSEFDDIDGIPPKLDGLVLDVRKNFMEISLGSDDGLKVGHKLEVFQDRTYKGRIVVRRTDPDRAVAEIIPELRKGEIQKGDKVRTKVS